MNRPNKKRRLPSLAAVLTVLLMMALGFGRGGWAPGWRTMRIWPAGSCWPCWRRLRWASWSRSSCTRAGTWRRGSPPVRVRILPHRQRHAAEKGRQAAVLPLPAGGHRGSVPAGPAPLAGGGLPFPAVQSGRAGGQPAVGGPLRAGGMAVLAESASGRRALGGSGRCWGCTWALSTHPAEDQGCPTTATTPSACGGTKPPSGPSGPSWPSTRPRSRAGV